MSILARLAQLQGLTIEGIPADEVISPEITVPPEEGQFV